MPSTNVAAVAIYLAAWVYLSLAVWSFRRSRRWRDRGRRYHDLGAGVIVACGLFVAAGSLTARGVVRPVGSLPLGGAVPSHARAGSNG